MEIEAISHERFASLTSGADHGAPEKEYAWYATIDRQVVGRIFQAPGDPFRFSVLHLVQCKWKVDRPNLKFDRFNDAEVALREEIDRLVRLK